MDASVLPLLKIILLLPIFLLLSVFVFYIPGMTLVKLAKKELRNDEEIILSFSIGLIMFLLTAIIFGILKVRFFVPLFLLLINVYSLLKYKSSAFLPIIGLFKLRWILLFLLVGTLVEGFINFPSGFPYSNGHLYWSSQGHDGLWHIAVIEQIKQNFPPTNPLYAGEKLYNYHYFINVIIAEFNRLFPFFSSLDLYFRYFSLLISFLMGLSAYSFLTTWKNNKKIGLLGIFFTYLVGSFGYLVLLIQHRGFFGGETVFWAAQGNTIIGNPPHAICYVLIPTFFLAFFHYLKSKDKIFFLVCCLLGGFLVGFKVSAAVVILVGLGAASFTSLWPGRNRMVILLTAIVGATNFITFKSITKAGESLLMFLPWWFIRTMIVVPDRVNWMDLELRRQFYAAKGGFRATLRIIEFETIAFLLFLIGNLGMRVIGFWEIGKSFVKKTVFKDPLETTMILAMVTGLVIPIFFVQKGVVYNLIQFMQYFLLIFGFFASVTLYEILKRLKAKPAIMIFLSIFIFLSVPTVIGNLLDFYGKNPLAIVTNKELEALAFLKSNSGSKDIILTKPFNPYSRGLYKSQPWPIYAWDSTGYVSAYTGRQTYYTDEGQMIILGIKTENRLQAMKDFFDTTQSLKDKKNFLEKANITYIYLRAEELNDNLKKEFENLSLKEVYNNPEVFIYKVN